MLLRNTRRPLAQLHRRLVEIEILDNSVSIHSRKSYSDNTLSSVLKSLIPKTFSDGYVLIDDCIALETTKMLNNVITGHPLIIAKKPDDSFMNFFDDGIISSSDLRVFMISGRENRVTSIDCTRRTVKKCIMMPFINSFNEKQHVLIPLLHHQV